MVKIWEVDFTKFNGGTDEALDNIGNQPLSSPVSISKISNVAEFSFRPGLTWGTGGVANHYDLLAGGNTNAAWNHNFNPTQKRSFVMWFYSRGLVPEDAANLWGDGNSAGDIITENGFCTGSTSTTDEDLEYRYDNGLQTTIATDVFLTAGWHNVIATIDRNNGVQKVYFDSVLITTLSGFSLLPSTTRGKSRIGGFDNARENSMQLGYVATYDHILEQAEVDEIFERFMTDSAAGEIPLHVISGTVFGVDNLPASGNTVYLIRESSNYIEFYTTTSGDGSYEIPISYSGNYTLVGTNIPNSAEGGRAQPFIATSGEITFL